MTSLVIVEFCSGIQTKLGFLYRPERLAVPAPSAGAWRCGELAHALAGANVRRLMTLMLCID